MPRAPASRASRRRSPSSASCRTCRRRSSSSACSWTRRASVAHLSHSNCVQVFDIGVGDNTYFIVMEYVDGADLKAVIEHRKQARLGRFRWRRRCLICVQDLRRACPTPTSSTTARATSSASCTATCPRPTCSSPGTARSRSWTSVWPRPTASSSRASPASSRASSATCRPKRRRAQGVDHRTDIFAVGIILWEMLAESPTVPGDTDLETVRQVQSAASRPCDSSTHGSLRSSTRCWPRHSPRDPDRATRRRESSGRT